MTFHVRISPGVDKWKADMARNLFSFLSPLSEHTVKVFVLNKPFINGKLHNANCDKAKGIFRYECLNSKNFNPKIYIAGDVPPSKTKFLTKFDFLHTCMHEFAHYEQYRDGKKIQERGIKIRTKNIILKMGIMFKKGELKNFIKII